MEFRHVPEPPQAGAEPELEEESPAFAATVEEPRKERTPRLDFHEEAARSQVLALQGTLRPVEKPLRHVLLPGHPQAVHEDSQLACHCHPGTPFRALAAP